MPDHCSIAALAEKTHAATLRNKCRAPPGASRFFALVFESESRRETAPASGAAPSAQYMDLQGELLL